MSQMHTSLADLEFDMLDRLHKSMRVSGMTAVALADELGVHRNTVNNYLTGRTQPDRRTLIAWAFSTGVPLKWLEKGEGGPSSSPDPKGGAPKPTGGTLAALTEAKRARTGRHGAVTKQYLQAA